MLAVVDTTQARQLFREGDETSHPSIVQFVASTAPDAELAELGEAFRTLIHQRQALQARRPELDVRSREIDLALIGADDRTKQSLLAERAANAAEVASLRTQRMEVARRHALARLAYFHRLQQVAAAEEARVEADELATPLAENALIGRKIHADDSRIALGPIYSDEQRSEMFARSKELAAEMQPIVTRRNLAHFLATMGDMKAAEYGDDVRLRVPKTWEIAAVRAERAIGQR